MLTFKHKSRCCLFTPRIIITKIDRHKNKLTPHCTILNTGHSDTTPKPNFNEFVMKCKSPYTDTTRFYLAIDRDRCAWLSPSKGSNILRCATEQTHCARARLRPRWRTVYLLFTVLKFERALIINMAQMCRRRFFTHQYVMQEKEEITMIPRKW